jgi:hypothetical protein
MWYGACATHGVLHQLSSELLIYRDMSCYGIRYLTMQCGMLSYATYAAINCGDVLQIMRLSCNVLHRLSSELLIAGHGALR